MPNAQERIALFRTVLASSSPDELKSYDLVWLLHIVGDIHQPLHASTRVRQPDPDGDAGGNLVKLDCAKCELHFFWDDLLGTENDLKTVVKGAQTSESQGVACSGNGRKGSYTLRRSDPATALTRSPSSTRKPRASWRSNGSRWLVRAWPNC